MPRPSWKEYFLNMLEPLSIRATCDRGKNACIITKNNRIISTGYVGAPAGLPSCEEAGHLIRKVEYENKLVKEHCVRTIHAEQNAILYAARYGVSIEQADLYSKMFPCRSCAMFIISAGITAVYTLYDYSTSTDAKELFALAKIKYEIIHKKQYLY